MALFLACSCAGKAEPQVKLLESGECFAALEAVETGGTLADALAALQGNGLEYEGYNGEYGLTVTALNGYAPDSMKGEFIAVYTTLKEYGGAIYSSMDFGSIDYGGQTLGSAAYGASGLPLVKGHIYVLALSVYE